MNDLKGRQNQRLSKKEQVDVLLHEYDSLRAEVLERHTVLTQVIGFAVLVFAGITAILVSYPFYYLLVVALIGIVFLIAFWRMDLDSAGAALRLCELEQEINKLSGKRLLQWESQWGGLFSPGFVSRDSKVREARKNLPTQRGSSDFDLAQLGPRLVVWVLLCVVVAIVLATFILMRGERTTSDNASVAFSWMNARLSPDQRADMVISQMTLDEKIQLTHGLLAQSIFPSFPVIYRAPSRSLGGAGYVPGIKRLGIPDLQMVDAASGLTMAGKLQDTNVTILPSPVALAAAWNSGLAFQFGTVLGQESRAAGFNVVLGGAVNLTREPRSGRVFENHGEDPVLAGTIIASELQGVQREHVISTIKHFVLNDQETGRFGLSANLDMRSLRESDLLAFQLGLEKSGIGAVMCAYNRVNEIYSCENKILLSDILKDEWGFKGWVLSDWGATHSTVSAALAGLDQELPFEIHYGASLKRAVLDGLVPVARLDDMVHRILRTMFAVGVVDDHASQAPNRPVNGAAIARSVEEEAAVLLKNTNDLLPLDGRKIHRIAVIGSHADVAVLSGGGSSQVMPARGSAAPTERATSPLFDPMLLTAEKIWLPSSPLEAIREKAPKAIVRFASGVDVRAAKTLAAESDVVLLFANQWRSEGVDLTSLSLSDRQDELIQEVAGVNPHTVVILETGGAALMPWLNRVSSVLEVWYPGASGGAAIANIIFGAVNPSGKLPISFPIADWDVPHPTIARPSFDTNLYETMVKPFVFHVDPTASMFDIAYDENLNVGYKWYDSERKQPMFPFGFGMSYTTFKYSDLDVSIARELRVTFSVANVGKRAGAEVAQVYLGFPPSTGEPPRRLVGWRKVRLKPGQKSNLQLEIQPELLSIFDPKFNHWRILPGTYRIFVGSSSRDMRLVEDLQLPGTQ